jgi:SAM-dependent MidA family methyltransferase
MTDTTPRPWHIGNFEGYVQYIYANTPKFEPIAKELKPADAALIVTAVNAHGDLVKALEGLVAAGLGISGDYGHDAEYSYYCEYCDAAHDDHNAIKHASACPVDFARSALAKAKGEKT